MITAALRTARLAGHHDYAPPMFDHRKIHKNGLRGVANVLSMHEHTAHSPDYAKYDYVIAVRAETGEAFQTEFTLSLSLYESKPQAYDVVNVKFDPKSHETVFDYTDDPRFDLVAMRAHTEALNADTARMRANPGAAAMSFIPKLPPNLIAAMPAASMPRVVQMPQSMQPAQMAQMAQTVAADPATAIERLAALHASGVLNDEQFEAAKNKVLGLG